MVLTDPTLVTGQYASTTGTFTAANQIGFDSTNTTGVVDGALNAQAALERIDATGIGAPIFTFSGNYSATASNISEWYDNRSTQHVQGATGQANGLRTFELPGTTVLNTVFDTIVAAGLPEQFQLTVSYLGGVSGASMTVNRLTITPRISPAPQIDGRASVILTHGDFVTFQITRSSGTISAYEVISEGALATTTPGGDSLNDIELQAETWDASSSGTLPTNVLKGYAYRVTNAPTDGSGRFGVVMYTNDWVVFSAETFTDWSTTADWFVIPATDVRRITSAQADFLGATGEESVVVRGADYAVAAAEIRMQIYATAGDYDAADLNNNGQIDSYSNTSDAHGRIAIRLNGTQAGLASTLPSLYVYAESPTGQFTRVANLDSDFTHQGDFASESDYLADADYDYSANDVLRIYETTTANHFTLSNFNAVNNIDDGAITEAKLSQPVQEKLNAPSHSDGLPAPLAALNNQAEVFGITHTEYRSNNAHVYLANTFALLKNAPTTFPNTASAFANEITGSSVTVTDPTPVTAIQDVGLATNNVMTGAGINAQSFGITLPDENNWRLVIGGWLYYNSLPTSYSGILSVRERNSGNQRDVFGMGPNGIIFRQRATTGSTVDVGITHHLYSTNGLVEESLVSGTLAAEFRVYASETYLVRATGRNGGVLQGASSTNYTVTAQAQDQAETTFDLNLGPGNQTFRISYDANRTLYGGRANILNISVDSIIGGLDEIVVEVLAASTTVTTSTGNTYNDLTISDGHAAAGRLMRYIASFRSVNGVEDGNLECVLTFFGYDGNGQARVYDENTFDLLYPALDLRWDDMVYFDTSGVAQNTQGFLLNPDTPLIEYPRHSTLRGWLTNNDTRATDWAWGNVHGPDQDTEAVYFPEFVNFPNQVFVDEDTRNRFRASVKDNGDGTASFNLAQIT